MTTTFVMRSSPLLFITLFITIGVQYSTCFKSSDYSNHVQLSEEYTIYWTVEANDTDGNYINLALSVKTTGWVKI
jgi:hypothetical protein